MRKRVRTEGFLFTNDRRGAQSRMHEELAQARDALQDDRGAIVLMLESMGWMGFFSFIIVPYLCCIKLARK